MRRLVLAATLALSLWPIGRSSSAAAMQTEIIPETTARRHGLTRGWFTQIQADPGRSRVGHIVLSEGILYVQTDRAMVHAIDAETGETLWARQIGRADHPSMVPGTSRTLLAVVNGSRLYVCDRFSGDLLYEVLIDGAPGAGAAVSQRRAYVPLINGMVLAYRLEPLEEEAEGSEPSPPAPGSSPPAPVDDVKPTEQDGGERLRLRQEYGPPLACRSLGRALVQPLVTQETEAQEFVVWPTDLGYLNIGLIDRLKDVFAVKYRLETGAGITAQMTYLPPDPNVAADSGIIFGASRDGFVHAVREKDGLALWRFSTGEPIREPALVIGQNVYVTTQPGGMYCLIAKTGSEQWWSPHIGQFVAASRHRVYAADKLGRILVLDAKTGARLDTMAVAGLPIRLINAETDRLYLATDTGLLQCLHEVELPEPIRHRSAPEKKAEEERPAAGEPPAEEPAAEKPPAEEPADQENPFAGDDNPPS